MKFTTKRQTANPTPEATNCTRPKRRLPAILPFSSQTQKRAPKAGSRADAVAQRAATKLQMRRDAPLSVTDVQRAAVAAVQATSQPTRPVRVDAAMPAASPDLEPTEREVEPASAAVDPLVAAVHEGARTPLDQLETEIETEIETEGLTDVDATTRDSTYVAAADAAPALETERKSLDKKAG